MPLCFLFCIGVPILLALGVVSIVCTIIAAVKANGGEYYRYPITVRMIT